jgi:hypothetical protein
MRVGGSLQMGLLSPPPPPPPTTKTLTSVHCCSRYLFKGLITLRFMWGGGGEKERGGPGSQVSKSAVCFAMFVWKRGGGDNWYRAHKDK